MFERFWRGDRARSRRGGGLGLTIAQAIVEAHGGRIWAEDRPGGGARVSFTLPAA
jgi:signal transduction histidine kinase